jgi:hypothetical protein
MRLKNLVVRPKKLEGRTTLKVVSLLGEFQTRRTSVRDTISFYLSSLLA